MTWGNTCTMQTPLKETCGNKYIITCTDYYSKWQNAKSGTKSQVPDGAWSNASGLVIIVPPTIDCMMITSIHVSVNPC